MSNELIKILITRDGMSEQEATEAIAEARELIFDGHDPEEILMDEFGLEADYIFDLLGF
jgi:hypothetical protein